MFKNRKNMEVSLRPNVSCKLVWPYLNNPAVYTANFWLPYTVCGCNIIIFCSLEWFSHPVFRILFGVCLSINVDSCWFCFPVYNAVKIILSVTNADMCPASRQMDHWGVVTGTKLMKMVWIVSEVFDCFVSSFSLLWCGRL